MSSLRAWQQQALARLAEWEGAGPFLISAAPRKQVAELAGRAACPPIRTCGLSPARSRPIWATSCARPATGPGTASGTSRPSAARPSPPLSSTSRPSPPTSPPAPRCSAEDRRPPPRRSRPGVPPAVPGDTGGAPSEPDEPKAPAYERRARLRDRRHALVSQLRREDGRSHREINACLNRAAGITRVDDASLDQLQRSINLLLCELDRRASRRRPGRAA